MKRSWRSALGLLGVLALVVLVAGDPGGGDQGPPLAPDGTGDLGAGAVVVLLEELGAEVEVTRGSPDDGGGTALLLEDGLDDERRAALADWVRAGGTLVVADPTSAFAPVVAGPVAGVGGLGDTGLRPDECDLDALAGLEALEAGEGVYYTVPDGARSCFGVAGSAFVVETRVGEGSIVAVGGPGPFTNAGLGVQDAAVLAAVLLAPEPAAARVAFLERAAPGGGERTLADLVPDRVVAALLQLGIAFGAYVWFRARRLGRPVIESQPTPLAGSELVAAVGRLRQQERSPQRAAAILQGGLRRTLGPRLGVLPTAPLDELVAAAERGGADPDRLRAVLDEGRVVDDDRALVTLAREIDAVRLEVLHERH